MSKYPGHLSGNNPPPYYAHSHWAPPPPPLPHPPHYPPSDPSHPHPTPYPYYVPGAVMIPVPVGAPYPPPTSDPPPQPTYITNYYYHGESSNAPSIENQVKVVENSGDFDWVPTTATTAHSLTGKAVLGGHEGWDGSPLWVIRSWHAGELIPGKLSVRHNRASVMYDGKEIPVQNIEVLCARPENLRWVPASNGSVPPGAIAGGHTVSGETLYVGRATYQLSVTPGKVHPSHKCCYIGFAGNEVSHRVYDVLTRI
ncbi:unnamed protein product [Diatraea saccharalis]|uniref:Uncharacterized protein n=1 Tax=Diatraea saccharalis TaxID=40085 RepID=A0A9N9RE72_9NEOP|nr:unnamed protein product [Diatraea saccharalis]